MSGMRALLLVLLSIVTGVQSWRIWQHERKSAEPTKHQWTLISAVISTVLLIGIACVEWVESTQDEEENRTRFEAQLTRLDTVVRRTSALTVSSHALADSLKLALVTLDSSLVQEKEQSAHQRGVLTSLRNSAHLQAIQTEAQQALLGSQQRLNRQAWRASYPLNLHISVYALIEYPADSVGLGPFVDSLKARSHRIAASQVATSRLTEEGSDSTAPRYALSEWENIRRFDRLEFSVQGGQITPEKLTLYRRSAWVEELGDESDTWWLSHADVGVQIHKRNASPPLELRFSVEADSSESIFQLDRNSAPVRPFLLFVDLRNRKVFKSFAVPKAYVSFRTADLSIVDLPCSTIRVDLSPIEWRDHSRLSALRVFFGHAEYQWQLSVPRERFRKASPLSWEATLRASDMFQTAWDGTTIARHGGNLEVQADSC